MAVPDITSISPDSGPSAGGTSVTVTGSGFTEATAVTFGSVAATSFTVGDDTTITAVSPAANVSGSVDIVVTGPDGPSAPSTADLFAYVAVPAVTGLNPASGTSDGGTSVTVTGSGFTGATAVNFGSVAATSFTVGDDTTLTAVSPAANVSGSVDVTVTGPDGPSATSTADLFAYVAVPAVTGLNPATGTPDGGTSVTVTGSGFTGATAVNFGSVAATSFTVGDDTTLTAVSPAANATGLVDVTVTGPGGTSPTTAADHFAYVAVPAVTGLNPASGTPDGGTSVTLTGSGFTGATAVNFGSVAATSFTVGDDTTITAVSPAANVSGSVDVTVTGPGGTSPPAVADSFAYTALPVVTALNPASGPAAGGTSVTVTGSGFTGATSVTFGPSAATSFTVGDDATITAVSPAATASGSIHVTVSAPGGTSVTSNADEFAYVLPTIEIVNPSTPATLSADAASPVADFVRFGLWDQAYDAAGNVNNGATETTNFVGSDARRFYFRVKDSTAAGSVDINWWTVDSTGAEDDRPVSQVLSLLETGPGSGVFTSRAVMLVTDNVDRAQTTDSGLTAPLDTGNRDADQSNHRTRRASMTGSVTATYPSGAGVDISTTVPIFQRSPEDRKKLQVAVINYGGNATQALIDAQFQHANARWNQVGLQINAGVPTVRPIPPAALDASGTYPGGGDSAEEQAALADLIPLADDNTLTVVFVPLTTPNAYTTVNQRVKALGDRYFVFMHTVLDENDETLAHELSHVLFNRNDDATGWQFYPLNTQAPLGVPPAPNAPPDVRTYRRIQNLNSPNPNADATNDNVINWVRRTRTARFPLGLPGLSAPTATTGNTLVQSFT